MRCLNRSLRAQRSNPYRRKAESWIASSQGLLAMTGKQLYFTGYIPSRGLRSIAQAMRQGWPRATTMQAAILRDAPADGARAPSLRAPRDEGCIPGSTVKSCVITVMSYVLHRICLHETQSQTVGESHDQEFRAAVAHPALG